MKKSAIFLVSTSIALAACGTGKVPEADGRAAAAQQPKIIPPFVFTQDTQGARQVGKGTVGYRFVLLEPNSNRVAANKPFVLAHSAGKLPFANAEEGVYFGTTDARGMTPVFVFETAVPENGFVLLERVGNGKNGTWLNLADNGTPLIGMAYTLNVCEKKPYQYHGITNTHGQTVYVAAKKGTEMRIMPYNNDPAAQQASLKQACQTVKSTARSKKAPKR